MTSARSDEFIILVGVSEDFFYVHALDCGKAIFDEESVGLPVLRVGAAVCGREVSEGVQVEGHVKRSCKDQSREENKKQHRDCGLWTCRTKLAYIAVHSHCRGMKLDEGSFIISLGSENPSCTPDFTRLEVGCDLRVGVSISLANIAHRIER